MRISRFSALFIICNCLCAVPEASSAEGISTTVYGQLATGYQDEGDAYLATKYPVAQTGVTFSSGEFSLDIWNSYEFAGGTYGNRDYGDEWEFTGFYDHAFDTGLCKIPFEASVAYWVLPPFSHMAWHMVSVYADAGCELNVGDATVTPYVRVGEWIGLGELTTSMLYRTGVRIEVPVADGWTASVDAYRAMYSVKQDTSNASFAAIGYLDASQAAFTLKKDVGKGLSVYANARFSTGLHSVFGIGFTYELGGRDE